MLNQLENIEVPVSCLMHYMTTEISNYSQLSVRTSGILSINKDGLVKLTFQKSPNIEELLSQANWELKSGLQEPIPHFDLSSIDITMRVDSLFSTLKHFVEYRIV